MKLRSFHPSDVTRISEIWEEHHSHDASLPGRNTSIIDAVVENDEGKIIAYGQVKLFAEGMMFLDHSIPDLQKAEALRLLMIEAFRGVKQANLDQMYAFIRDPDFAKLMQKHFGFEPADRPGDLFLRRL